MAQNPTQPTNQPQPEQQHLPQSMLINPRAPAPAQPPAPQASPKNPGQVFGIIGIVLSFIFLAPIGLTLSIIGTVKSRNARSSAAVSIIGIVLNSLAILAGTLFLFSTLATYSSIQHRAQDVSAENNAQSAAMRAEQFFAEKNSYPTSAAELAAYSSNKGASADYSIVAERPTNSASVQYVTCGKDGAQIIYLVPSSSQEAIVSIGNASSAHRC